MNSIRRIDADAYLPAVDLKNGDDDVLAYLQGFAGGAGEDEHGKILYRGSSKNIIIDSIEMLWLLALLRHALRRKF